MNICRNQLTMAYKFWLLAEYHKFLIPRVKNINTEFHFNHIQKHCFTIGLLQEHHSSTINILCRHIGRHFDRWDTQTLFYIFESHNGYLHKCSEKQSGWYQWLDRVSVVVLLCYLTALSLLVASDVCTSLARREYCSFSSVQYQISDSDCAAI